uniref:Uncharacterized protein n=1 Tax=Anopheles atroparvus TaxID=41427 RepID=A0A182JCK8_ANOAO
MLQDVGAELAHELAVLVVDLDLVRRRPLGHDDVAGRAHHRHPVRVEQLAVALAALAELELEATLLVEDLYPVVVRVRHDDVVLRVHRHPARLRELALHHAELAELAVVDHLLPLDLALRREHRGRHQLRRQVDHGRRSRRVLLLLLLLLLLSTTSAASTATAATDGIERDRVLVGEVAEEIGAGAAVAPLLVRVADRLPERARLAHERAQTFETNSSSYDACSSLVIPGNSCRLFSMNLRSIISSDRPAHLVSRSTNSQLCSTLSTWSWLRLSSTDCDIVFAL